MGEYRPGSPEQGPYLYSERFEEVHSRPAGSFTTLPARIHSLDVRAAASARRLGSEASLAFNGRVGAPSTLALANSPVGHLASLMFPECLPERLESVVTMVECVCYDDDMLEKDDETYATGPRDAVIQVLTRSPATNLPLSPKSARMMALVGKLGMEIIAKFGDEGRVVTERCVQRWFRAAKPEADWEPTSLEDYVAMRTVNIGAGAFWATLEFSLGVVLSTEEHQQIRPLMEIADRLQVKINDYFSWDVEKGEIGGHTLNTMKYLIEKDGHSEEDAKNKMKALMAAEEEALREAVDRFHVDFPDASPGLKKFVPMVPLLLGGIHRWSAACDRYHPSRQASIGASCAVNGSQKIEYTESRLTNGLAVPSEQKLQEGPALDETRLVAPADYIRSLPSKNIRSKLIDALNVWFQLSSQKLDMIRKIIDDVHNSTLLLDDIEDGSELRRGSAAAHQVFGTAQCINTANYMVVEAARTVYQFDQSGSNITGIFLQGLKELAIGQSWDLSWKADGHCPTVDEYMGMVDGKTGAMFKMTVRLMHGLASTTSTWPLSELDRMIQILGRWFQIRDDFQNLQDEQYTAQKGFCEDLDEGKISYPVILACHADSNAKEIILRILRRRQREKEKPLALAVKMQILDLIRRSGALDQTWQDLRQLEEDAEQSLSSVEAITGRANPLFRTLAKLLSGIPRPRA